MVLNKTRLRVFLFPGSVRTVYWHGATRTARLRHVNQNATHMWLKARLLYRNVHCAHRECQNRSFPPFQTELSFLSIEDNNISSRAINSHTNEIYQ